MWRMHPRDKERYIMQQDFDLNQGKIDAYDRFFKTEKDRLR